ncbi:hypothetical protein V8C26DRAFT_407111 [Trichoderma gracile]
MTTSFRGRARRFPYTCILVLVLHSKSKAIISLGTASVDRAHCHLLPSGNRYACKYFCTCMTDTSSVASSCYSQAEHGEYHALKRCRLLFSG